MVKTPPCSAGDAGSIRGQGTRLPHAAGQEAHVPQLESLRAAKLESPHTLEPTGSGARAPQL